MSRNPRARDLQLHKAHIPKIANTDLESSICMDTAEEMPKACEGWWTVWPPEDERACDCRMI
jgi:hypothetical protein